MNPAFSIAAFVTAALLALPAVARDAPLENRFGIPVTWNKSEAPTLEIIQHAIIAGCSVRRWQCRAVKPGEIRAVLLVRKHMAESRITFDTEKYSVTYVDSRELRYDPVKK